MAIRSEKGKQVAELALFLGYLPRRPGLDSPGVQLQRFKKELPGGVWRTGGSRLVKYTGSKRLPASRPTSIELAPTDFAAALLGPDEQTWIGARPLVGFVGDHPTLEADLNEPLRVVRGESAVAGSLSSILREGNMMAASPRSLQAIEVLQDWDPELVVFDGGDTYRKWRNRFTQSHHAVVLDRSAVTWDSDFESLASAYHHRSDGSSNIQPPQRTDTAVEILVFAE